MLNDKQKLKKEMQDVIETFEYNTSGKRGLNGGFADVKILKIETHDKYYKVYADVTLGDCFDEPKSETYHGCYYHLDKKDLHLLRDKEFEKLKEEEDE